MVRKERAVKASEKHQVIQSEGIPPQSENESPHSGGTDSGDSCLSTAGSILTETNEQAQPHSETNSGDSQGVLPESSSSENCLKDQQTQQSPDQSSLPPNPAADEPSDEIVSAQEVIIADPAEIGVLEIPEDIKLPPMGFADEILSALPRLKNNAVDQALPESGAETIFSFADQLLTKSSSSEVDHKKQRLETWVTFSLADEIFGLPVSHVQEILRAGKITRVPNAPAAVMGITNMRGKLLPVVDLRKRMGLEPVPQTRQTRILVTESKNRQIGLLVDAVEQVILLDQDQVQQAPADVLTDQSNYIIGVVHLEENLIIMLDINRILLLKTDTEPTVANKDSLTQPIQK
jgi:purine-binding chemotaxis protein CheW